MVGTSRAVSIMEMDSQAFAPPSNSCVMVVFGASGDMAARLLVPALYNLACENLLNDNFSLLGTAIDQVTTEQFRDQMTEKIKLFHTREEFDQPVWDKLVKRFHYLPGDFRDIGVFQKLKIELSKLSAFYNTSNMIFYLATAPGLFGMICRNLHESGFKSGPGWKHIVVEKPFGTDLKSALQLNREILAYWDEDNIYRVDHYLGKETVQNLLAFRFGNAIFEPLWNRHYIDNIQFSVTESVGVEGRGEYYDRSGVVRDMLQNHMLQMLSYLCMETPDSLEADAIRDEKTKLLQSVRVYSHDEVSKHVARGQYGPLIDDTGKEMGHGYRGIDGVDPKSETETYAAARLQIDNERWKGVPIYLRSGKALWKRGTEIVVEFKKEPMSPFVNTPLRQTCTNRLIFHIQPHQGIEMHFYAKTPGPRLRLQPVHMGFRYEEAFKAPRYTGYEVMIYSCSHADVTLFSRGDLVEAAWRIAQPIIDYWSVTPAPEFPNYARGSWGPKAAADLIERDGRHWYEVVPEDILRRVEIFREGDPLFLSQVKMALDARQAAAGETIIEKGEIGHEMYLLLRGEVEVIEEPDRVVKTLKDGDFFGEIALLLLTPRNATIRAKTACYLLVLNKADFDRILYDHPRFAESLVKVARSRYSLNLCSQSLIGYQICSDRLGPSSDE